MFLLIILTMVLTYLSILVYENSKNKKPPGPFRIPPFGNIFQLGFTPQVYHKVLQKLATRYGDVMSIQFGSVNTIVLSSYDAVRSVFALPQVDAHDCRGIMWTRNLEKNIGIVFSDGPVWTRTRKFCKMALASRGFGNRNAMEGVLLEEIQNAFSSLDREKHVNRNQLRVHSDYFDTFFLNIMLTWTMNTRFECDDPEFLQIMKYAQDFATSGSMVAGLLSAFPFLRHILTRTSEYKKQMEAAYGLVNCGREFLRKQKGERRNKSLVSFADAFLAESQLESQESRAPIFTDDHFALIFADLVNGGSHTTSSAFKYILLHLALNPKIQANVFKEVMSSVGRDRTASIDDRVLMPYTQAVILETLRWGRAAVFGLPRKTLVDVTYKQYRFKKGTVIMFNLQSIFFDKTFWGDPDVFRPERFLDGAGFIDTRKSEKVIVFGAGKRSCFGEAYTRDALFMFTTAFIQRFEVTLAPGPIPSVEPVVANALFPESFSMILTMRNSIHID